MKSRFYQPLTGISSYNLVLACPSCAARMELVDLRDGDQAYWCHTCQRGWRAGHLPENSRYKKNTKLERDASDENAA
jgi:transposase-like protein